MLPDPAAIVVTTETEPTPARNGIVKGVKVLLPFCFDSCFASSDNSWGSDGLGMPQPPRMMMPPATRIAGIEIPKNSMMDGGEAGKYIRIHHRFADDINSPQAYVLFPKAFIGTAAQHNGGQFWSGQGYLFDELQPMLTL